MALASGMGLNAIVAYQLAGPSAAGTWQAAMGLVVLDGIVVLLLVLTGLREAVLHAIPRDLRLAIGAGIGLFIALIGLVKAGIVIPGPAPDAPLAYGNLHSPATAVALIGLLLTAVLVARRVRGALVIGILAGTAIALVWGVAKLPSGFGWPKFDILFKADIRGALRWELLPLLFSLVMVDFFDTLGTATGIAYQAGLYDDQGRIPSIRNILIVDSLSASIGGLCGVSSVTCYIESASGVAEGARTGLHSVFVGLMFLLAVFLAPVAGIVPAAATAPALILVGFLMIGQMASVDFAKLETAIPAFVTLLVIPMTYSIAHGIGYGFIVFVVIKMIGLKFKDVHPLMYAVAAAFAAYFIWQKV
jgi:AGZA family xanthine/uracil permease-like MFS transporter